MIKESGIRVAIDIGSSAVKMLQAVGPAERPVITGIAFRDVSGVSGAEVSELLKSLAGESRISAKNAAISLSGPSVIVRFISLPRMDDAALKGAIRYEAEKFIPYNINDCIIDFQVLKKDDKDNKLNLLLVAAKKEYVQEKIKVIEHAGFSVRAVDVDCFAVANAFMSNNRTTDADKTCAMLNIGGVHTNVSILKGDLIYFARDIAVGGNDFTLAVSRRLAIDQKSAEELKIRPVAEKEQEIADSLKGVFNDLLDEIKLSFGYYENQAGKEVDEVYVSGGGSNISGLEQAFEEALGSKPVLWNPLKFADISSGMMDHDIFEKVKSSFAIAAGLISR